MSVSQQRRPDGGVAAGGDATMQRARRLADDLARRWAAGERPLAEEYLAGDADLAARPDAALEIVYEELCQRQQIEAIDEASWFERFPAWRAELEMLLACHRLFDGAAEPRFPEVGDRFGEFLILAELGRGLQGRVYLARQPALADRPVVLKVTPLAGQEHLSLARLQHTHIVPLYGAHDDPTQRLRALWMPYFGGVTLAHVLERLRGTAPARRTGRDLLDALSAAAGEQALAPAVEGPACRYFERATYVEAICWLAACLADALDDAHQRNLIHLDLKPSNVLLAADGQPMLLDFHLAQPPIIPGQGTLEWLGGTPGYMPPEQEAALAAIRQGGDVPQRVDRRADVYSLALLLCEALAGLPPQGTPPARWLRAANPKVGVALSDLIGKCLSPDANQRYPGAGALAEDLRRHLAHQPLRYVANRSLVERWRKWRRRRPYALAFLALFAALGAWGLMTAAGVRKRLDDAQAAVDDAEMLLAAGHYERAAATAQQARQLASSVPWPSGIVERLRETERIANAGQVANDLHALVERFRELDVAFRSAMESSVAERAASFDGDRDEAPSLPESRLLHQQAERLWKRRDLIVESLSAAALKPVADRTNTDLAELAVLWADLHVRLSPKAQIEQAGREALLVLHEAQQLPGTKLVVYRVQERLARLLGDEPEAREAAGKAERLVPSSAWEHLALGRLSLSEGRLQESAAEFAAAVELEPQQLWPNFYAGRAAYEQGRFEEAVASLTACVAVRPRAAWCYCNRGLAYAALERLDRAIADFDHALELDPNMSEAALHRGALSYQEGRYDEALVDLQRAEALGADPIAVHYNLALVYAAQHHTAAALKHLDQVLLIDHDNRSAQELAEKLRDNH